MPTTAEVQAAKIARANREAKRLKAGPPCPVCKQVTSLALVEATGDARHPCCMPSES